MNLLVKMLLSISAILWIVQSLRAGLGVLSLPRLGNSPPLADPDCPRVSIVFAARNEAEKLPAALRSMLALDYPSYDVIAVDDRSDDDTGAILGRRCATSLAPQSDPRRKLATGMARQATRTPAWLRTGNRLLDRAHRRRRTFRAGCIAPGDFARPTHRNSTIFRCSPEPRWSASGSMWC